MKTQTKKQSVLDWTDEEQKVLMEQYEELRSSSFCNMFNMTDVSYAAEKLELTMLKKASSNWDLYKSILRNFNKLMKKFDIKQGN